MLIILQNNSIMPQAYLASAKNEGRPAPIPGEDAYNAFIAPDESFIIVTGRATEPPETRNVDLFVSFRTRDAGWTEPVSLGPAINSSRSLFLYGPPGNGKTTVAEIVADILGGEVFVPHAIEVDGQVIKVYDPLSHQAVDFERRGSRPPPIKGAKAGAGGILVEPDAPENGTAKNAEKGADLLRIHPDERGGALVEPSSSS